MEFPLSSYIPTNPHNMLKLERTGNSVIYILPKIYIMRYATPRHPIPHYILISQTHNILVLHTTLSLLETSIQVLIYLPTYPLAKPH